MACSVHIRRFLAVVLCCVLAFHSALPVARAVEPVSASISIAAGAIALGGLSAAAVESTIGPQVAAIIGTTLQGLGTSTYTSEDSALSKTQFIMEKIAVWCLQAKMAKEDFYKAVASGISVAADGTIQLGKTARDYILKFGNWLYTQDGLVVENIGSSSGDSFSVSAGDVTIPLRTQWAFTDASGRELTFINSNNPIFVDLPGTSHSAMVYSFVSGTTCQRLFKRNSTSDVSTQDIQLTTTILSASDAAIYGGVFAKSGFSDAIKLVDYPDTFPSFYYYWQSLDADFVYNPKPDTSANDDVFIGNPETWLENNDLLNPEIDDVTTLTPDLINKLIDQLADGQTATMDIATYLDSLVSAFDGLKSQVAELTDTVTGIKTNVAVPDSITTDVTVDPVNPISFPTVEPVELTPGGTIEGFSFALDEIFPFCIPFDVVAALELFDVPAEAPSLHIHWDLPYNIVFDFDLDLSAYDDIAALLRVMETILFAVGLAVATRSLYIRS